MAPLPVLLICGLYLTPRMYADQLPELWRFGPVTVADHTRDDDLDALAERILADAPPRFALAGLSMGGYLALSILRQAPQRVDRVALMDTAATPDAEEQTALRRAAIELLREERFDEVVDEVFPRLVHPSRAGDPGLRALQLDMLRATGAEAAIRQQTAIIHRPDARPGLADVDVPALVLVGDSDRITPPERAAELVAGIAGARLVTVPACGHLSTLERPEAVT
ncbi:MAG TPA: alpha/beta fold hydrolase, partial [Baekduia sp.]|uniref:alpha/beta fold hydrolase n=1 Tax=Baekduia sp. TaxID=2600305 RepID=UPI002C86E332